MQEIVGFLLMVAVGLVDPLLLIAYYAGWWCRQLWIALSIGAINGIAAIAIVGLMANRTPPGNVALSKTIAGIAATALVYGIAKKVRQPKPNFFDAKQKSKLQKNEASDHANTIVKREKLSGWHRLLLCLTVAWLVGVSFLAVPEFKNYRGWGVGAGCYEVAKNKMLDKVQENYPAFNRKAYVEHAEYPNGRYAKNSMLGTVPADRLDILPIIARDYKSINFKPIFKEMNLCIETQISRAKSASFKRNLNTALYYYGLLGMLPLLGLYVIGRLVILWIIDGSKEES